MHRATTVGAALVTAAVLVVSSCGTSGRELREAPAGVTAPPRSTTSVETTITTTTEAPTTTAVEALTLSSPTWGPQAPIPERYTCDGEGDGVSPPLEWAGVPEATTSLAITVIDPSDGFVHWAVIGIDPALGGLGEGAVPEGAQQLPNDNDETGWLGPCPPPGQASSYQIRLLAFEAEPSLPEAPPAELVNSLHDAASDEATLVASYERP